MQERRTTTEIPFDCPLCGSNLCLHVVVRRPSGDYYETSFFKCAGCSVVFLDPESFSLQVRHTYDPERKRSESKPTRPDALAGRKPA
jgi:uncharacterized Zn finger protein